MNPQLPRAYRVTRVILFSIAIFIAATFPAQSEPTPTPPAVPTPTPTPCLFTTFSENFDGASAPLLPQGWTAASAQGTAPLWVTSTTAPASPPNAAFIDDPATVSDKHLDSRNFLFVADAGPLQVSFLNNYALDPVDGGASFFDGGVLEISVNGGPFVDITAVGSFVTGGYNGTISTEFGSPIGGRMAWSQSSSGYLNTVVNLSNVQNTFKLRFRMCSDSKGSGEGWRIDNLVVSQGCGGFPTPTPTPSPIACSSEGFNDITTLAPGGWFMQNNSQPGPGITGWFQGDAAKFDAQAGATNSYIGTNYNNGTGTSTLSNWLLTPPLTLRNGGRLSFWTRTVDTPTFPDRLQVRMSTNGASTNVGTTATSVGDFTTLLLDINPTYTMSGYPNVWTQFTVTLSGIASPTTGRLALRYFVENGGPTGVNSDYIGVDSLILQLGCPKFTPPPAPTGTPSPTPTPVPPTPTKCPGGCTPSPTPTPSPSPSPSPSPTPPPASPTPTECPWCFTPTPSPSPTPVTQAINLSTRLRVDAGDNVGIGGLIITGTEPKPVLIRAIGPSLGDQGIPNPLADPMLRLHGPPGFIEVINNNWRDTQEQEIIAIGIPPTNDLESAIVITLDPGPYTAIVSGNGGAAGVALLEIYDLNPLTDSKLANLSTRALVLTGSDIVIAGFLLSDNGMQDHVIVRGIGPSLSSVLPANSVLANPILELRDSNAALIITNDDWQDDSTQAGEISGAGLAPANALESAASANLSPGLYTALLSGTNSGTGIGVVEIYDLGP